MDPKALIGRTLGWIRHHPEEVVQAVKDAVGMRLTVPLDALRFLAAQATGKRAPENVEISAEPPGVRAAATLNVMKTPLRVSATLFVEHVHIGPSDFRIELRLKDVGVTLVGESDSPVAAFIRSGALNLNEPGRLIASLPKRPAFLVEAEGDRVVLDLMRDPKIAARLNRVTQLVSPVVTINRVESRGDALTLQLSCLPEGFASAVTAIRAVLSS